MAGKKSVKKVVKKVVKKAASSMNSKAASASKKVAAKVKQTKNQVLASISAHTGLAKKEVLSVFESLGDHIVCHMKKGGSGEFTIPETGIRVKRKTRPATKKRLGRNPATGEQIMIAAKPARTVVKIIPLRALKECVAA
jgi:nucleoid DNA-binding protein